MIRGEYIRMINGIDFLGLRLVLDKAELNIMLMFSHVDLF